MKKILIVDDEPMMLKLVNRALQNHYETLQASSGEEGIRLFEQERPDMVLSDLKMPAMSGYELQQIIQDQSEARIPFIFMTADENDENESKGLEQGAADYIHKPINAEVLLKRIERVFTTIEENSHLKKLAHIDAMTGLYNKFATEKLIGERIKEKSGVFAVVDLDSFKLVNDLYGHNMGDRVLVRFAELIRSVVREGDIVGRIGGDEFVIFFEHLTDSAAIAEKTRYLNTQILRSAKEYMGEDMNIPLGCSAGATYVTGRSTGYADVFQKADAALYRAKQGDKHGYCMYEEYASALEGQNEAGGFSDIRVLYGERNPKSGAYIADPDTFRGIFRFLNRMASNYPWHIQMVLFSFSADREEAIPKALDAFIEQSAGMLRSSDIFVKHGADRVLLLLLKSQDDRYQVPLDRIMQAWQSTGVKEVAVSYETESLLSDSNLSAAMV